MDFVINRYFRFFGNFRDRGNSEFRIFLGGTLIKLIYSENATKFSEIFTLLLTVNLLKSNDHKI